MVKPISGSSCPPRYATPRSPDRETLGPAILASMRAMGFDPMPWQEDVVNVGGELLDDGTPAFREVVYTPPRQSGKTTIWLGVAQQRASGWYDRLNETPQRIAYSAQDGAAARAKLLDDQVPVLEKHRRLLGVDRVMRSNGHESVTWKNGSKLVLLASSEDSGHGQTIDCAGLDELFADKDFRRDQAITPAMATRKYGQKWACSTAGTPDSVVWNSYVERGRLAAEAGKTTGTAYLEWSAPEDSDPADPATWFGCMPALGRTITLPVIEAAYQTLELGEFKRAFLNIPTLTAEQIIPAIAWDLVNGQDIEATAACFALDVNPERSASCFAAAGQGPVLEIVDYRAGTGWVLERGKDLSTRFGVPIVVDQTGPAAGFADELERDGVKVVRLSARDVANASGRLYDRVVTGTVKIRRHGDLDRAVSGANKRLSGDSWAWGRSKSSVDISPLMAITCALSQVDQGVDPASNVW